MGFPNEKDPEKVLLVSAHVNSCGNARFQNEWSILVLLAKINHTFPWPYKRYYESL
jgi:hypothetical protein